jgi:phospholipase C
MSPIKHVILVMMENRSYDNVLGMLYPAGTSPAPFAGPQPAVPGLVGQDALNGLTGTNFSNPVPNRLPIPVTETTDTTCPAIDPREPFESMAQQYLGLANELPFNPTEPTPSADDPYLAAPLLAMNGFAVNYALQDGVDDTNVCDVLTYFTPSSLPVTAFLAQNFMVCDQWFASVPTQTFVNRIFSLAAQAGTFVNENGSTYSYVDDIEFTPDGKDNPHVIWGAYPQPIHEGSLVDVPTVFRQLDAVLGTTGSPPNWKVYFRDYSIAQSLLTDVGHVITESVAKTNATVQNVGPYDEGYFGLTGPATTDGPWPPWAVHHVLGHYDVNVTVTTFQQDLDSGKLPGFCVIEPQYSCNFNPWWPWDAATVTPKPCSNHPGQSSYILVKDTVGPLTDCADGEQFLAGIVSALYQSEYWDSSVIVITYDEGGGMFDHVFPPAAVPPSSDVAPTYTGAFTFERLGGRVPAIIVSPYAYKVSAMQAGQWPAPGATSMPENVTAFDHTSVIKTVWEVFGLDAGPNGEPQLTDRDGAAPSILPFLSTTVVNDTVIPNSTDLSAWSSPS